ncbi:MAG: prepilin-type N-terminal cleavage/methylation domain-containing protein [Planctomycetota bacterium]
MAAKRAIRRGFTLIEILIVVIILGILAAIVIPQFTNASQEAIESSIKSQLQTVRGQIELFRVKSGGTLPTEGTDGLPFEGAEGTLTNPGDLNGDTEPEAPFMAKAPIVPKGFSWVYDTTAVPPAQVFSVSFDPAIGGDGFDPAEVATW